jgi:glycosyltransferase involved in cell wall biosynthesis
MQIYYWCPFLSNVATINSVKNSASSLKKYSKKKFNGNKDITILNSCGEWNFLKNNNLDIKIKNLLPFSFYKYLPKTGLIQSRISFIIIFIFNFFPLLFYVKKNKPNFLIIHLLTLLPILLSPLISKNTKIVLRISGLPKMNFFRKFIWKQFSSYIFLVTTPTQLTSEDLINLQIFDKEKIHTLRDPIINCNEINIKQKSHLNEVFLNKDYYLSIGRLTNQKNFKFLIKVFSENCYKFKNKKLVIIGEGENYNYLQQMIVKYRMGNNIYLIGFKKNVYKYLKNCLALISVADYEDPGFTLIEAAYLKKKIITSLVRNGPIEMKKNGDMCYFFEPNNEVDFVNKILNSEEDKNTDLKLIKAQKFSNKFTIFSHYKSFEKLLS